MEQFGNVESLFGDQLRTHDGVGIGESHGDAASIAMIRRLLPSLARSGVKTIGWEYFKQDLSKEQERLKIFNDTGYMHDDMRQCLRYEDIWNTANNIVGTNEVSLPIGRIRFEEFKRWDSHQQEKRRNPELPLPADPRIRVIDQLDRRRRQQGFDSIAMLNEAHALGIRFEAIDDLTRCQGEAIRTDGERDASKRLRKMNDLAVDTVRAKFLPRGKYVLLCGTQHLIDHEGVEGLAGRLGIPAIHVASANITAGHETPLMGIEMHENAALEAHGPAYRFILVDYQTRGNAHRASCRVMPSTASIMLNPGRSANARVGDSSLRYRLPERALRELTTQNANDGFTRREEMRREKSPGDDIAL